MGAYGWLLWVMMMGGGVRLVAVGDDDAWGRTVGCVMMMRTVGCCG